MLNRNHAARFLSPNDPYPQGTPEKALCVAILERAILDLTSPNIEKHIRRSARHWLFDWNDETARENLNLGMICELLNIDIPALQRTVRSFIAKGETFETSTHHAKRRYAA